jgi:hypothetical protein
METARLKALLGRQLKFLQNSSAAFDNGDRDEAIRIATTIRVMIHQTAQSTSLLTLLGGRDTIKLVTAVKPPPTTRGKKILAMFDGITTMGMTGLRPALKSAYYSQAVGVEDWWNQLVLVFGPENRWTRRTIVLAAANKDGGAHVDPNISQEYRDLIDGLWTLTRQDSTRTTTQVMTDHQFIALGQFAYELLNSPELIELAE